MDKETERRPIPLRDLSRLNDAMLAASTTVGAVVNEEAERRIHRRFDELAEEMVGPMSRDDLLRLAVVMGTRQHGVRLT